MVEKKDARFSTTIYALGSLLIMLIAGIFFVRTMYNRPFSLERTRQDDSKQKLFPQPQPGHFSAESLQKLRANEATELNVYHWGDDAHTEAQVPAARAIELYEAHHDR